jgi:hypothetical protein
MEIQQPYEFNKWFLVLVIAIYLTAIYMVIRTLNKYFSTNSFIDKFGYSFSIYLKIILLVIFVLIGLNLIIEIKSWSQFKP